MIPGRNEKRQNRIYCAAARLCLKYGYTSFDDIREAVREEDREAVATYFNWSDARMWFKSCGAGCVSLRDEFTDFRPLDLVRDINNHILRYPRPSDANNNRKRPL